MMWAVYGAQFLAILGIDRLTKYFAVQHVLHERSAVALNRFAEIKVVFNRGISWGMLHSEHCILFSLLTLLIVCIISVLARAAYVRHRSEKPIYAEIAVLAGAVSNVIDRLTYGGVVDFIHLHVGDWSWPIFNVADVAIVLGILWMIKGYYYES